MLLGVVAVLLPVATALTLDFSGKDASRSDGTPDATPETSCNCQANFTFPGDRSELETPHHSGRRRRHMRVDLARVVGVSSRSVATGSGRA